MVSRRSRGAPWGLGLALIAAAGPARADLPAAPPAAAPPSAVAPAVGASTPADELAALAPVERLTLATAVQRALARNPNAAIALEEVRRAEATVREVRAGWLPTVAGNATYTRLDGPRTTPTAGGGAPTVLAAENQLSASVLLTVPLVVPQRWAQWSHAKDNVEPVRLSDLDVRRQLAVAVARAYLTAITQRRVAETSQRARDNARAHFEFARTRFTGGIGTRLDAVRAEQELMTDEAQLQGALASVVRAEEALGVLLGGNQPAGTATDPELAPPPPLGAALDELPSRRPDVQAQEARLRAARHAVRDDWTDYAPFLVGNFGPFYQAPATATVPQTGWQAQLILTVPLYDGGLRYGQARERDALLAESKLTLDGLLLQARSDVRVAFDALRRTDEALRSAQRAAALAAEALRLADLAYHAGATTNLEVIDAERSARDAETAAALAEDGARQARLDLLSASGRFP